MIDKSAGHVPTWRHLVSNGWEWSGDYKTTFLYIWLVCKANWEPKRWKGITVDVGQYVTSLNHLATETGMTKDEVRTALRHLHTTHYITHESHRTFSVITVNNYNELYMYSQTNPTVSPQSAHSHPTDVPPTKPLTINHKPLNNNREGDKPQRATFKPPDENSVIEFFKACKSTEQEAKKFYAYYSSNGWRVGKNKMVDWKSAVRSWLIRAGQYMPDEQPPPKSGRAMADYNRLLDEELDAL